AEAGHCSTCDQDVPERIRTKLRASLPGKGKMLTGTVSTAMLRLADLSKFNDVDNSGEVRQLSKRLRELKIKRVDLGERLKDPHSTVADTDTNTIRRSEASYGQIAEQIAALKIAIDAQVKQVEVCENNVQRFSAMLLSSGNVDIRASKLRASVLDNA